MQVEVTDARRHPESPRYEVSCQEISATTQVVILKESPRKGRLYLQYWKYGRWDTIEQIGKQPSQAQALVHAGAFLQSVKEMTGTVDGVD
ncbi:MAG: hypothetical protein OXE45_15475 [bacterium]|nr:hypothetical protein [bacterium]